MSRLKEAFKDGKAFIPFITCGDPDLETTAAIVKQMSANGADIIELGIPFSDPTAEGPVIQEANIRALAGGVTTDMIFDFVREIRKEVSTPMECFPTAVRNLSPSVRKSESTDLSCPISHTRRKMSSFLSVKNMMLTSFHS